MKARIKSLAVDNAIGAVSAFRQIDQGHSRQARRDCSPHCTCDRGKNIDELRWHRYASAGQLLSGKFDHQRNVQYFAIEEYAVLRFTMIIQSFAMVAAEDDERWIVEAAFLELREKTADDCVGGGNFSVIRIRILGAERLDRLVRGVRFEQMEEKEERLVFDSIHPAECDARCLVATALQCTERGRLPHFHGVIVE